jgi:hypothetical protein
VGESPPGRPSVHSRAACRASKRTSATTASGAVLDLFQSFGLSSRVMVRACRTKPQRSQHGQIVLDFSLGGFSLFLAMFLDCANPASPCVLGVLDPNRSARDRQESNEGARGNTFIGLIGSANRSNRLGAGNLAVGHHRRGDPVVHRLITLMSRPYRQPPNGMRQICRIEEGRISGSS